MKRVAIWIDNMDGDVYYDPETAAQAVEHALKNGAKKIIIEKWDY